MSFLLEVCLASSVFCGVHAVAMYSSSMAKRVCNSRFVCVVLMSVSYLCLCRTSVCVVLTSLTYQDPTLKNKISKVAFVVFYQGTQLETRVRKICDGCVIVLLISFLT